MMGPKIESITTPMTATLTADAITAGYHSHRPPVLAGVTAEVRSGEFVGVVGPNGCGKSTLVRVLSRALRPSRGSVCLDGNDLYTQVSAREAACAIGVVPQVATLTLDFTVQEIVSMGRAPHLPRRPFATETAHDEQIVTDALHDAGIAALSDRVATTLSGGEWQRVLLARALAQEPDVLLLDEPTAHLDIQHGLETLELAQSLAHARGRAVLAVLHDLNAASAFCDRLLLLAAGKIVAQGTPDEVLTAEIIERVYGTHVWVGRHPILDRPLVLPLPFSLIRR
jgi:iron complex transport system ATP-binding protein